jgi:hypothetical protein
MHACFIHVGTTYLLEVEDLRVTTSSSAEDAGSMNLGNVGILPQHYMGSQSRRPGLETSPP